MRAASHLPGLDHLRALAIVLVFLYHYGLFPHPAWVPAIGNFGWIGVDLFFVLSGFLIADQLFRHHDRSGSFGLGTFYARRAMRILPAYAVMVLLYFLFPVLQERDGIAPPWKFASFTMNLGLDLRTQGSFSHAWSLCVEEHFYLLLPVILVVISALNLRHAGWVLAVLFLFGFTARAYAWQTFIPDELKGSSSMEWMRSVYYPTPCRLDGLLAGVGIAALVRFRPKWHQRINGHGNAFFLLGAVFLTAAWWMSPGRCSFWGSLFIFPLVSIGFGSWVLAMLSPSFILHARSWNVSTRLAELAFAVYLVHKAAIHLTQSLLASEHFPIDGSLMFVCCLAASLAAALALRLLVERPFLALRDKWSREQAPAEVEDPKPLSSA